MVLVRIMYIDITIGRNLNDISCCHFVSECEKTLFASKVGLGQLCGPNLQDLVSNHSLTLKYRRHAPCFVLVDRLPTLICHCKPLNTYFKPISSSTGGNLSVRSHTMEKTRVKKRYHLLSLQLWFWFELCTLISPSVET